MAVVKADAYGHGAGYVSRALQEAGASWFGVSNLDEAMQIRNAGIVEPILILAYTPPEEAARLLAGREGNILLATGAKELPAFAALEPARLFPRVLPSEESVAACRRAGIPSRNIIALYGPFTQRLNEALMEQYHIRFLVTKDGGEAGGFREKAAAALAAGVELVVIRRPRDRGEGLEDILAWFQADKEEAEWK